MSSTETLLPGASPSDRLGAEPVAQVGNEPQLPLFPVHSPWDSLSPATRLGAERLSGWSTPYLFAAQPWSTPFLFAPQPLMFSYGRVLTPTEPYWIADPSLAPRTRGTPPSGAVELRMPSSKGMSQTRRVRHVVRKHRLSVFGVVAATIVLLVLVQGLVRLRNSRWGEAPPFHLQNADSIAAAAADPAPPSDVRVQ